MNKVIKLFDASPDAIELLKDLDSMKEDLENIIVVYQRKDQSIDTAHTFMIGKDLLFLTKVMELYVSSYVNEEIETSKEE